MLRSSAASIECFPFLRRAAPALKDSQTGADDPGASSKSSCGGVSRSSIPGANRGSSSARGPALLAGAEKSSAAAERRSAGGIARCGR
jgi:hypothetical protein